MFVTCLNAIYFLLRAIESLPFNNFDSLFDKQYYRNVNGTFQKRRGACQVNVKVYIDGVSSAHNSLANSNKQKISILLIFKEI